MQKLTPVERSALRAEAHALKPVVIIGEAGLTPAVIKEISASLDSHGLIKVRVFGDDRAMRAEIYDNICTELDAAPVQHIGKLLVIYRPKVEVVKERSGKSGKGMREVTIVKASASGTKRPSVTKVMIKGNERVTEGGSIKRAKPRQSSPKKGALGK
ncbi:YhbY family RNA-binding protein [Massilia sp. P8910]|uniref:YhbY family RNA-binding protein n=1 Tax=Massilia antarctica TaxID=2765360 RepID=A0AA48WAS6_9BURK|nr:MULTISPECIES: YhbY family RNA-binding protein [Massilia]CUI08794.1 FIG004454: RNA binding protein [Janthinobacterium sp. CG23_2]MCE3602622.1 YhbY family RNA-binding protein [Massilia antarctica]MCY0910921.1 YhbY family RNA-binding protein [Massilia sp. H27-R4]QPI47845.1 YhbY family RNA-binding protein [Massilia antarctica]CUU32580.1 FIG004454: RNA binding protein [Janthinobacterium sp. CG23_2]